VDLNTGGLGAAANTYILIGSEVLKVTAVSTNALTVIRAQDGTTATTHLDAAKVFLLKSNVKIEKEPYAKQITETTINEGAAFSKSDTTLTVTSGTTLGAVANSYILIGSEKLLVTAVSTNDLTVTRGQDGTAAAAHADGAKVFRITVTTVSDAGDGNANLAAADTTLSVTLNDPGLFAAVNSYIRIGSEVMLVTAVSTCVEINQCVGCTRKFFTKSFLGDDAAALARSSGEEPALPRHRADIASIAWRSTRFSTNAP